MYVYRHVSHIICLGTDEIQYFIVPGRTRQENSRDEFRYIQPPDRQGMPISLGSNSDLAYEEVSVYSLRVRASVSAEKAALYALVFCI